MATAVDFSVSMTAKRSGLAAELAAVLAAHEAGFTVSTRYELRAERPGASKLDRDDVMNSPIQYARVSHIGSEESDQGSLTMGGGVSQVHHVFAVYLWREYTDDDANQTIWDGITEGQSPDGVLTHLRSVGALEANGEVFYLGQPEDVIVPDEPLNMGDEDYSWYLQFFITLT